MYKVFFSFTLVLFSFVFASAKSAGFKIRAFYIDCRVQVMTVSAIKEFALDLSKKGINALLIEYEATFPFEKHSTLTNSLAYSRSDIKEIVKYCASLGMDVIPLQNCFGHCEYILRHDRYASLREDSKEVSQVCPLKIDEAKKIFREIFEDVASLHPSKYFHIGADETYLLGNCKNCSKKDKSRLFVDYVKAMCQILEDMGKTPIIWADIILKYNGAAGELPKNLVFVDWNYGWSPDKFGNLEHLFKLDNKIWGASALRSSPDNICITDWMKHFENISVFLPFARAHGYEGIIDTSWSTSGIYGFHYDAGYEILEMYPIRQVYPMSGFQILIDAFCKAVSEKKALDPQEFILSYAGERYGLSPDESRIFLEYFRMPQPRLHRGKSVDGTSIDKLISDALMVKKDLDAISAKKHAKEFEHYRLMLDLRINYLEFKSVEAAYNSEGYEMSKAAKLNGRLRGIIERSNELGARFIEINKAYLKPGQLEKINSYRTKKMESLHADLLRQENIN